MKHVEIHLKIAFLFHLGAFAWIDPYVSGCLVWRFWLGERLLCSAEVLSQKTASQKSTRSYHYQTWTSASEDKITTVITFHVHHNINYFLTYRYRCCQGGKVEDVDVVCCICFLRTDCGLKKLGCPQAAASQSRPRSILRKGCLQMLFQQNLTPLLHISHRTFLTYTCLWFYFCNCFSNTVSILFYFFNSFFCLRKDIISMHKFHLGCLLFCF